MEKSYVSLKNCNNIKSAKIELIKNALNIKFGFNGTGKSTLASALEASVKKSKEELNSLLPYGADENKEDENPSVGDLPFSKIKVFNEDYVGSYVFKQEGILEDSFQVFLRTGETAALEGKINEKLSNLQNTLFKNQRIHDVLGFLESYINAVGFKENKLSRRGGMSDLMNGGGIGFDQHPELVEYKPFYQKEISQVISWADWRNKGVSQIEDQHCPFCAKQLAQDIDKQNATFSKVFKKAALNKVKEILDFLEDGVKRGYISDIAKNRMVEYFNDTTKTAELETDLKHLAIITEYFYKKMSAITGFRPANVKKDALDDIEKTLTDMKIEKEQVSRYYDTKLVSNTIDDVNMKIDELLKNTGELKGLFLNYDSKLAKNIQSSKDDINEFFALAGFPYEFNIITEGEDKAHAYLQPIGQNDLRVSAPERHLSWGERNAFALVMFMFEAVSEEIEFVVLDDPISSFDINKKFAVVRRIFDNRKKSFKDKTVMLLTHDMEPIIDCIRLDTFKSEVTTPAYAYYIENVNGIIKEKEINKNDLKNTVSLTEMYAGDTKESFCVRVVNLRKHIELTCEKYNESDLYHVLSSLIHGREVPTDALKKELSESRIKSACEEIKKYLVCDNYTNMLKRLEDSISEALQQEDDSYATVIAVRLLLERHRSEDKSKDWMIQLRRQYPAALKYLNETNHIENDYIFQLNPHDYFFVPDSFRTEIDDFLRSKDIFLGAKICTKA